MVDDYGSLRWSIREPGILVWSGLLRRDRRAPRATSRSSTATACPARAGSRRRASTSPRTCCGGATPARAHRVLGRGPGKSSVTYAELYDEVSRLAQALRAAGVKPRRPRRRLHAEHARDRHRHARGGQHRRDLVVVLAGFRRAGRARPLRPDRARACCSPRTATSTTARRSTAAASRARSLRQLPSVEHVDRRALHAARARRSARCRARSHVHDFMAPYRARDIEFAQLPFNHPLYILYSSGTTGVPKCIVHGAGGTLLQHLKEHAAAHRPQAAATACSTSRPAAG